MATLSMPSIKVEDYDLDRFTNWNASIDSNSNNLDKLNFGIDNMDSENRSKNLNSPKCSSKNYENNNDAINIKNEDTLDCFTEVNCQICGHISCFQFLDIYICHSCKIFFLKSTNENQIFECKLEKKCEILPTNRGKCKYCRYQKCLQMGLYIKDKHNSCQKEEDQILCVVCNDIANGVHFGAITCEGCKKFFRRGLLEHTSYVCKMNQKCDINPQTRNSCRLCRYNKCLYVGMSREAIQMGRPSKSKQNKIIFNRGRPTSLKVLLTKEASKTKTVKEKENKNANNWNKENSKRGRRKLMSCSIKENKKLADSDDIPDSVSSTTEHTSKSEFYNFDNRGMYSPRSTYSPYSRISPISKFSDFKNNELLGYQNDQRQKFWQDNTDEIKDKNLQKEFTGSKVYPVEKYLDTGINLSEYGDGKIYSKRKAENNNNSRADKRLYSNEFKNIVNHVEETNLSSLWKSDDKHHQKSQLLNTFPSNYYSQTIQTDHKLNHISDYNSYRVSYPNFTPINESINNYLPTKVEATTTFSKNKLQIREEDNGYNLMENHKFKPSIHHFNNVKGNGSINAYNIRYPNNVRSQNETGYLEDNSPRMTNSILMNFSDQYDREEKNLNKLPPLINIDSTAQEINDNYLPPRLLDNHIDRHYFENKAPNQAEKSINIYENLLKQRLASPEPSNFNGNSPYSYVMVMLTNCQLYTEASKEPFDMIVTSSLQMANKGESSAPTKEFFDSKNAIVNYLNSPEQRLKTEVYWLSNNNLPDENYMLTSDHLHLLQQIVTAYGKFVRCGTNTNQLLKKEFDAWISKNPDDREKNSLPGWIQEKVVPVYTYSSITYCKNLPGFSNLDIVDQASLVRLGQTPSRILIAAIHWFNSDKKDFDDFLSWRMMDLFKKSLIGYAEKMHNLQLDLVESALLNALIIIATDYPGLEHPEAIEEIRKNILIHFRSYTTAKFGTPNQRLENLFRLMPEARELGFLHYKMTLKKSFLAEEVESKS